MIPDTAASLLVILSAASIAFMVWCLFPKKVMLLIHKLYFALCASFVWWSIVLLFMKFSDPENDTLMYVLDALTQPSAAFAPIFMLMIAMTFVSGVEKMPRKWLLLFIIPVITNIVVWTNPLHHLHYRVFSVFREELVFGPYIYVNGAYNYICTIVALFITLRFAIKSKSRVYLMQGLLFTIGDVGPLIVSILATTGIVKMNIASTPLSFILILIFHYIAIYRLHMLDIKPIATQHVLDCISDCYMVLAENGLVLSSNMPFREIFGRLYGIYENRYLSDCVKAEDIAGKTAIYNLLTNVESCRNSRSTISYEQAVNLKTDSGEYQKLYYIAEITPLIIRDKLNGFVVIFKDITQVKRSMQQLQDSQRHMMENERLAFLGQMVGGLAHNLKTPIMSISGCMFAEESLINEALESLGDPEVTEDDYREIFAEMQDWVQKARESCAYMSDIITAIKGQAANASTSAEDVFTLDELIKRSTLLMRHELMINGCHLVPEYDPNTEIVLNGDINNLIQVLNNLISNAIYAEKLTNGDKIYIGIEQDDTHLSLYVRDTGPGVEPRVKQRLFKEMVTSKGSAGTGLGLYISNAVVRGKFGGYMWVRDVPSGGAIFGFAIPLDRISISRNEKVAEK
ncbi:MAG: histidine kinase N-terminal 7TM domain-containing protein [Oscillospiraceae bacterium]